MDWCEAPVGGWILEPANTWSNLAYVAAGLVIVARRRRGDGTVAWFGPALLLLGLLSGLYHASVSFVLQVGDFIGMFVVTGLALALNLHRLGILASATTPRFMGCWLGAWLVLLFVAHVTGPPIQTLIGVQVAIVAASEVRLWRRGPEVDRRFFLVSFGLLLLGSAFSAADLTRLFCRPEDHVVQGHALWHVLSAASILALWRFHLDAKAPCALRGQGATICS